MWYNHYRIVLCFTRIFNRISPVSTKPPFEERYPTPYNEYKSNAPLETEKRITDAPQVLVLDKGSVVTFNPERRTKWSPFLDVYEDDANIYIEVDLPGFKKERIDLNVFGEADRNTVIIMGEEESIQDQQRQQQHATSTEPVISPSSASSSTTTAAAAALGDRKYLIRERHPRGRFKRTIHLPAYALVENISATYKVSVYNCIITLCYDNYYQSGLLQVTVPKLEESKRNHRVKKIEIRDAHDKCDIKESAL